MSQGTYTIHGVNGPVVTVVGGRGLALMDMVNVGEQGLTGEVVRVDGDATVQVYEDTAGLMPGQQGAPGGSHVHELGPGLLATFLTASPAPGRDPGQKRPLYRRGLNIPSLDREKKWHHPPVKVGDRWAGAEYAPARRRHHPHRCLIPAGLSGQVTWTARRGVHREEPWWSSGRHGGSTARWPRLAHPHPPAHGPAAAH